MHHFIYRYLILAWLVSLATTAGAQDEKQLYEKGVDETFSLFLSQLKGFDSANGIEDLHQRANEVLESTVLFLSFGEDKNTKVKKSLAQDEVIRLQRYMHLQDDLHKFKLRLIDSVGDSPVFNNVSVDIRPWIFAMYKGTSPQHVLLYFLFIPGKYINQATPRILSWKMCYLFGKYYFEDAAFQVGTEEYFKKSTIAK